VISQLSSIIRSNEYFSNTCKINPRHWYRALTWRTTISTKWLFPQLSSVPPITIPSWGCNRSFSSGQDYRVGKMSLPPIQSQDQALPHVRPSSWE
jgi:hypothetical protein